MWTARYDREIEGLDKENALILNMTWYMRVERIGLEAPAKVSALSNYFIADPVVFRLSEHSAFLTFNGFVESKI